MEIVLQNSNKIKENKQNNGPIQWNCCKFKRSSGLQSNWKESFIILKCMLFALHQLEDLSHAQEQLTS